MESTTASERLADRLRAGGLRLTPQRRLVLDAVAELGHATPEDVSARLQAASNRVSTATVYRTLELLEDLGLVTHTHLGHGPPTYHPAEAASHVHLVCRGCGDVLEVDPSVMDGLVAELQSTHGFQVDVEHVAVFGRCRRCEDAPAA